MTAWVGQILEVLPGRMIRCCGVIPENLEVFQDHFPDFSVLPGVLALEILRESIDRCIAEGPSKGTGAQHLLSLQAVKFQQFLRPGESWESYAIYIPGSSPTGSWNVKLMVRDRIAVSARMIFSSMLELVTEV